ncbi:hypothetical protein R1sor_017611 [Riccia sorocarpa]|uniref:Serine aminopeptidase S33 domain-containing protein n=1 Tax=Riccia sorocarpa TaxID=122646 RepID=A0ABD3IDJ9_9MARC
MTMAFPVSSCTFLQHNEPHLLVHRKPGQCHLRNAAEISKPQVAMGDISEFCALIKSSGKSLAAASRCGGLKNSLYSREDTSLLWPLSSSTASGPANRSSVSIRSTMAGSFDVLERKNLKLSREYTLTDSQVSTAKSAFDAFIRSVATNPERREGAYPYYLLHKPGEKVYGTVLFFHGFSNRPDQMWRLAQYLFDNGFNVYQPSIHNHYLLNPDKNWAQVDLKPQWKGPIRQKFLNDPVLKAAIDGIGSINNVTDQQTAYILQRVHALSPDMDDIVEAINDGDYSDKFKKYYDSSHLAYVEDAEARLKECESLPGPAFTIGLSVGGSVALGLAAHRPDKIAKVVAYAPLLKQIGEARRQATLIAGPLDVKESGWDPKLQFTVGCYAATDVFGNHVLKEAGKIAPVPTFLMLTENDDSADIDTNKNFTSQLKQLSGNSGTPHLQSMYTADMRVPHPMVDPIEVSQGMTNRYWVTLYQETFRFLTEGTVNDGQLKRTTPDPSLPKVPPV